jgi:hypothetical protein
MFALKLNKYISQKHDNKPVCAGVWARMAGGRCSDLSFKRENWQYSLGGGVMESPSFFDRAVLIEQSARSQLRKT